MLSCGGDRDDFLLRHGNREQCHGDVPRNVPVGAPTVNTVLAVYDPLQSFAAGTGRVLRNGSWGNFATSVKYDKTRVLAGGMTLVEPSSTGDVVVASTSVQTIVKIAPTAVMITGPATINGASGYLFGLLPPIKPIRE